MNSQFDSDDSFGGEKRKSIDFIITASIMEFVVTILCCFFGLIQADVTLESGKVMTLSSTEGILNQRDFNRSEEAEMLSKALLNFTGNLFPLLGEKDENVIFSAFGLHNALSMLIEGSKDQTKAQLLDALSLGHEDYGKTLKQYGSGNGNENVTEGWTSVSRVFAQETFRLFESYMDFLWSTFKATVESLDFSSPSEAVEVINAWAENGTNGKIEDVLSPESFDGGTTLILANAIHFKGVWAQKFSPKDTKELDFHVNENKTVKVATMHVKAKFGVTHLTKLKSRVLQLPFRDEGVEMLIFLPDAPQDFDYLNANFASLDIDKVLFFPFINTKVWLPKFNLTSTHDLKSALMTLGAKDVFSAKDADLSAMGENANGLFVSEVTQKAAIEVNEEGAEAAAVSAVIVKNRMAFKEPQFILDRPFAFIIRDIKSGINLFIGRVIDPTAA